MDHQLLFEQTACMMADDSLVAFVPSSVETQPVQRQGAATADDLLPEVTRLVASQCGKAASWFLHLVAQLGHTLLSQWTHMSLWAGQ